MVSYLRLEGLGNSVGVRYESEPRTATDDHFVNILIKVVSQVAQDTKYRDARQETCKCVQRCDYHGISDKKKYSLHILKKKKTSIQHK